MIHRQASRIASNLFAKSMRSSAAKSSLFAASSNNASASLFGKTGASAFRNQSSAASAANAMPAMAEPINNHLNGASAKPGSIVAAVAAQSASGALAGTTTGETESSDEAASTDDENDPSRRRHSPDGDPGPALFSQLPLSPFVQEALKYRFKYDTMSPVQEKVLECLPDIPKSLMVKARTGTGKTLAFLIGALENPDVKAIMETKQQERKRIIDTMKQKRQPSRHHQSHHNKYRSNRHDQYETPELILDKIEEAETVPIVILSPTRELASQIAAEAARLGGGRIGMLGPRERTSLRVMTAFGGTSRSMNVNHISTYPAPDVLVATPGRLIDLLETETTAKKALKNAKVVVFDEADTLLDMGFKPAMLTISKYLPKDRQTFMFSATFDQEVKRVARELMSSSYTYVNCVPDDEPESHTRIQQSYVVCPYAHQFALLYDIIKKESAKTENPKIMVFWNMGAMVDHAIRVFELLDDEMEIMYLHSKLAQNQRTRISRAFRTAQKAILFSTDVSARGVDYPNVSLVIQMGIPDEDKTYVHRIGRTARAGKEGRAILVMAPHEQGFLEEPAIRQMVDTSCLRPDLEYDVPAQGRTQDQIQEKVDTILKNRIGPSESLFRICLFASKQTQVRYRLSPRTHSSALQSLAKGMLGYTELPTLQRSSLERLGIRQLPGFEIEGQGRVYSGGQGHSSHFNNNHSRNSNYRNHHHEGQGHSHYNNNQSRNSNYRNHQHEGPFRRRP